MLLIEQDRWASQNQRSFMRARAAAHDRERFAIMTT
jgi:hypothetical protein